jgi:uncharacterized protein YceK
MFAKCVAVSLLTVALCGCGVTRHYEEATQSRKNVEASLAVYKACLATHPNDVHSCDAARLSYEADLANEQRVQNDHQVAY